jgi:ubiquinone/menaquinone biosynthesis C-methylase UbiE
MSQDLDVLYQARFDSEDLEKKARIWKVLCSGYFQKFVRPQDTVLDLACGTGEFINNIHAAGRIGVDLRTESEAAVHPDVRFLMASATDLSALDDASVDCVFTSNFLEHLPTKDDMLKVLSGVHRILRPGGRFLIMGPNIRYVPGAYWDFFDHHLPLTERSVAEALLLSGFCIERVIDRFLPYSTKSRFPQAPWLVALYLKTPIVWTILGKQFFVVGRRGE